MSDYEIEPNIEPSAEALTREGSELLERLDSVLDQLDNWGKRTGEFLESAGALDNPSAVSDSHRKLYDLWIKLPDSGEVDNLIG